MKPAPPLLRRVGLILLLLGSTASVTASEAPPAAVELANVGEGQASPVTRLPGTVISTRDSRIAAERDGRLIGIARVGEQVEAGAVLAQIDSHRLRLREQDRIATLAGLDADIDYHQRQISRLSELARRNNMARAELDQVEARLQMLQQEHRVAEIDLERTRYDLSLSEVRAPFAGVIAERHASEGEYTRVGDTLLRLVDTHNLEVSVKAPLQLAQYNRNGTQVQVHTNGLSSTGRIRSLVPVGDARSRQLELRLELEQSPWLIGQALTVELPSDHPSRALQIPRDALVLRDGEVFVYVVAPGNTARKVPVKTGSGTGTWIAVEGALNPGEPVIVRGAERLREGQSIKVIQHHIANLSAHNSR